MSLPRVRGGPGCWLALLSSAHRTERRGPIGFGEAWAAGLTQALLDGPLGLPETVVSALVKS